MSTTASRLDYRIPSELSKLLNRDSYSLLVKGSPGTGKTALALTILSTLDVDQRFLYISTRTSLVQLFLNYPWLSDIVHVTRKENSVAGQRFITDRGVFVDARLDEQSTLFQTITDELMNTRAPFIVVDSWDAVGDLMNKEAFLINAKVLQTWRERASAKLIFTSEGLEQSIFDFLVEGIAILRQSYVDGRRIREIHLSKLYGTETTNPSYFFTLNKGVFRSFDPYHATDFVISSDSSSTYQHLEDVQSINPLYIPSCFPELDRILGGGFPIRSVAKIKIGHRIDSKAPLVFLGRMLSNLVKNGNPIVFQPFGGIEVEQMTRLMESCSPDSREKRLTILSPPNSINTPDYTIGSGAQIVTNRLNSFEEAVSQMRERFPNKILLAVLELSSVAEHRGADGDPRSLKALLDFARRDVDLSVIVTRQPETAQQRAQIIAETHLEIADMKGTLFLRSNVPHSQFFAIIPERESGSPTVRLEPML